MCYAVVMPRFEPFAGLRYDSGRVDLSQVVAPPYDVIGPEDRAQLAARHSANTVVIDVPEPDPRAGLDRYANAARHLARWEEDGILVRDPQPVFYAYRMTSPDGHATNGVIGALGIADTSDILPHEQTLPKAKSDRLDLMRSTTANLSPIWGLSLSKGLTATFLRDTPPDATAVDDDGVRHELWVISDDSTIDAIRQSVAAAPVVIADGHHRYETALTYRAEVGPSGGFSGEEDRVMALVVELAEDQLAVGPIHRGLSGLPDGLDLVDAFSSWFDVTRAGDFDERTTTALGQTQALALIMPSGAWLLTPKDGTPEAAGSDLDSSMVALVVAELPEHTLEFFNSWQAAVDAVRDERAQAAVLLRPVSVTQIAEWAHARKRMSPKTTYFKPKPRTGMVFRTLAEAPEPAGRA
jgi:uncharacterized protein (DUF1015 family)